MARARPSLRPPDSATFAQAPTPRVAFFRNSASRAPELALRLRLLCSFWRCSSTIPFRHASSRRLFVFVHFAHTRSLAHALTTDLLHHPRPIAPCTTITVSRLEEASTTREGMQQWPVGEVSSSRRDEAPSGWMEHHHQMMNEQVS